MTGNYVMQAIPPYCKKVVQRVRVVRWLGNRVLLEQLDEPKHLIETDLSSFEPDIPKEDLTDYEDQAKQYQAV